MSSQQPIGTCDEGRIILISNFRLRDTVGNSGKRFLISRSPLLFVNA